MLNQLTVIQILRVTPGHNALASHSPAARLQKSMEHFAQIKAGRSKTIAAICRGAHVAMQVKKMTKITLEPKPHCTSQDR